MDPLQIQGNIFFTRGQRHSHQNWAEFDIGADLPLDTQFLVCGVCLPISGRNISGQTTSRDMRLGTQCLTNRLGRRTALYNQTERGDERRSVVATRHFPSSPLRGATEHHLTYDTRQTTGPALLLREGRGVGSAENRRGRHGKKRWLRRHLGGQ